MLISCAVTAQLICVAADLRLCFRISRFSHNEAHLILHGFLLNICPQLLYEPRHENPLFCICENKGADQLRINRAANQRLYFRYIDRKIPLLPKSEISSLWPSSEAVQPGLCRTLVGNPEARFSRHMAFIWFFVPHDRLYT